jgi:hypothetical protein
MAFVFHYYSTQIAGDARRMLSPALLNRCSYDERMAILDAVVVRELNELMPVQRVAHLAACYDACVRLEGHAGWFSKFGDRTSELRNALETIGAREQKNILISVHEPRGDVPAMQSFDAQYVGAVPAINPDLIVAYVDANRAAFLPGDTLAVNEEMADAVGHHIAMEETATGLSVSVRNSFNYVMPGMPRSSFTRIYRAALQSSPYGRPATSLVDGADLTAAEAANLTDLVILHWVYFYCMNDLPVHIGAEDYEHPYSWRIVVQFTERKFGAGSQQSYEAAAYFLGKSADEIKAWHEGDQYMQNMR